MTLDRLTIILPWPDTSLMPNRKNGKHWGSTQAAKVRARQDGAMATRQAIGRHVVRLADRIPVKITFVSPDARSRDLDNCLSACKHLLDGVALGLGVNDKQFRPITIDDAVDTQKKGFLLMEIGE